MPSPSSSRRALSRRTALLGTLVVGTAACTPYSFDDKQRDPDRPAAPVEQPEADPDVALAATVLAAEQALVDRVDATLDAHPRLAALLAGTRATHAAHVDLLADAAPESPVPSPSTSPSTAMSETPEPEPAPRVPRNTAQALRALARHEDELSLEDKRSAFAAQSGSFARVLASMAASAAQQSAVLRAARVPGRAA
ncbi:MAG: hypothetical protein ACXWDI_03480 [Nocardioides sp.]